MWRTRSLLMTIVGLLAFAEPSFPQRGTVHGTVVDPCGDRVPYANVIVLGSFFGAMTRKDGGYVLEVPSGRCSIKATALGYRSTSIDTSIGLDEEVLLNIVLGEPAAPEHYTVVPPKRRPVSIEQPVGRGDYPASTTPVRFGPLECIVRYSIQEEGDMAVARIVAEGRNVTDLAIRVCGCFSFWKLEYMYGPEVMDSIPLGGTWKYRGPRLDVATEECGSPVLECEPIVLTPDATVSREMSFSFDPAEFANWTGEIAVTCVFFRGNRGYEWVDTENVALGPLVVPIRPIGMPYRRP